VRAVLVAVIILKVLSMLAGPFVGDTSVTGECPAFYVEDP